MWGLAQSPSLFHRSPKIRNPPRTEAVGPARIDGELPPDRQVLDRGIWLSLYLTLVLGGRLPAWRIGSESRCTGCSSRLKSVTPPAPKSGYNSGNPIASGGSCEAKASLWRRCSVVCGVFRSRTRHVRSGSGGYQAHRSSARLVPAPHRVQPRCARPAPGPDLPGTAYSASGDAALAGSEFRWLSRCRSRAGSRG